MMLILLFIIIAYLLLRVTSKLWAPLLMVGVLLMGISIMLVPRLTILNSPYYVHKYKNVIGNKAIIIAFTVFVFLLSLHYNYSRELGMNYRASKRLN